MKKTLVVALVVLLLRATFASEAPDKLARSLADFGPLTTPQQANEAYAKALETLGKTGGLLLVPRSAAGLLRLEGPPQALVRIPPAPAPARTWREGPAVTILEAGERYLTLRVPPMDGLHVTRTLRLPPGESLPHWGTHPMVTLESKLVHGSNSYLDWLQEPVSKGADRRFYLPTIRGIRPGQFLNVHGGLGYGGGVLRAYVKSIGYDRQKKMHYFVADTNIDHKAGAIVHNKSNTGILHMTQTSNSDNQTYDVKVIRNQYAHGDTYVYYCDFNYMSNVHSAAGDENGNCFSAFIRTLQSNLRGKVEQVDWTKQQLTLSADSQNLKTLGDSRPLINRNEKKWITRGKVWIVPAASYWETTGEAVAFGGKAYPTRLVANPVSRAKELRMGGLIRGDKDCPWTDAVVGRFFALAEPSERVRGGNLRWYEIASLEQNPDGTKDIEIVRYWWGTKKAGSPTLYRRENYSWDGHLRPLPYVIAPGIYVNDVSRAIPPARERTVGLVPYADRGNAFDFGPGDPVEQAIGPDPFKPQAFRVWAWEDVPGAWPSAMFDIANHGAASRYAAMAVRGGAATLEGVAQRQEQKPAWDNVVIVESACSVGVNFAGDVADAALLFQQPTREQPIVWRYTPEGAQRPSRASLTVSRSTGALAFKGGGLCIEGGLSGSTAPARNLRGKNVKVAAGATSATVAFPAAEADADYAAFVETSWLADRAVAEKAASGFTVQFARPAPDGATLDWMIVR